MDWEEEKRSRGEEPMIMRRIIGIAILLLLITCGAIAYIVLQRKVKDVESDLVIAEKKDIKGRK